LLLRVTLGRAIAALLRGRRIAGILHRSVAILSVPVRRWIRRTVAPSIALGIVVVTVASRITAENARGI
jgi:hypothetical protein